MKAMMVAYPKFLEGSEAGLGLEVLCLSEDGEVPVVDEDGGLAARDTPSKPKGTAKVTIDVKTVVA